MLTINRTIIVLIVFSFVIFSGSVFAENKAGLFTLNPHGGGFVFDNAKSLSNGSVVGLGFGYNYTDHFGVEANFSYINSGSKRSRGGDADGYMYRLDGIYNFVPERSVVPYLSAGLGAITINNERHEDDTDAILGIGGGFKYYLSDDLAFRADVRQFYAFEDSINNYAYTFGVTFHFGGKAKEEPKYVAMDVDEVTITLAVEFDFDKAEIRTKYHRHLKEVAEFLKKYPDTVAVIEGHTDNAGPDEYNLVLSQKRANSVRKYLIDKFGIPHWRLDSKGYGESRPIADNSTKKGRQRNRRVTAVISSIDKK
jgi:OOP family OmpA-OmpF porin